MGIHNVLKSSLDGLDHTEKQLFLDIACFFEGRTYILSEKYKIVATFLILESECSKIDLLFTFQTTGYICII